MADRSKWDVLLERHQKAYNEEQRLARELGCLENTTCNLTCSDCGKVHETEAEFAQHYLIPDERYLNLGYCPNKEGS
jgi:hypothetical protein